MSLRKYGFCNNWCSERHTLLTGVYEHPYTIFTSIFQFVWNWYHRSTRNPVEHFEVSSKGARFTAANGNSPGPKIKKMGVQCPKLKNGQMPRPQTKKNDGAEF